MNDTILKAVLNKVAVWKQMYSEHDPTADEINDRNWLSMCVVLSDRITELEEQLDAVRGLVGQGVSDDDAVVVKWIRAALKGEDDDNI